MKIEDQINVVLDKIRPLLQYEGGDIELVKYEDGIAYLTIKGACTYCYMLGQTLEGIEMSLSSEIPEIKKVELI